jgi:Helix-turn-helix domain
MNPTKVTASAGTLALGKTIAQAEFSFPAPSTVKGRVLGALLRGERLTHLDCWRRFGSARLSHHIYCLRGTGWPVQMAEETVTTTDAGRPASIGVYFLTPETIEAAGERGQRYAQECARVEAERRAA